MDCACFFKTPILRYNPVFSYRNVYCGNYTLFFKRNRRSGFFFNWFIFIWLQNGIKQVQCEWMLCRPSRMFSSESCSEIMIIWSSWSDGMYKILEFSEYLKMNSGRNEAKVSINVQDIYNCLFKTPTIICTSFYWLPYSGKFAIPLDMYTPYAKWALIQTLTWKMFVLKVRC